MAAAKASHLVLEIAREVAGVSKVNKTEPTAALTRSFSAALTKEIQAQNTQASQAASVPTKMEAAPTAPDPTKITPDATKIQAQQAVQRTQQLDSPQPSLTSSSGNASSDSKTMSSGKKAASGGDAILTGIQKLRGVFTAQMTDLNKLSSQPISVNNMFAIQAHHIKFGLMAQLTSKMIGKAAQVSETLMKG